MTQSIPTMTIPKKKEKKQRVEAYLRWYFITTGSFVAYFRAVMTDG